MLTDLDGKLLKIALNKIRYAKFHFNHSKIHPPRSYLMPDFPCNSNAAGREKNRALHSKIIP